MRNLSVQPLSRPRFESNEWRRKLSCFLYIQAADTSETSVSTYKITRYHAPDASNRPNRCDNIKISLVRIWNIMFLVRSVGLVHEGHDVGQEMGQEAGTLRSNGGISAFVRVIVPLHSILSPFRVLKPWCNLVSGYQRFGGIRSIHFRAKNEMFNVGARCHHHHHQGWDGNN